MAERNRPGNDKFAVTVAAVTISSIAAVGGFFSWMLNEHSKYPHGGVVTQKEFEFVKDALTRIDGRLDRIEGKIK